MASGGHPRSRRLLSASLCSLSCYPSCYDYQVCPPPPSPSPLPPPAPASISNPSIADPLPAKASPHHRSAIVPTIPLAVVSLLFTLLILLALYVHLFLRRRRRHRIAVAAAAGLAQGEEASDAPPWSDEFFEELEHEHHFWYIRTVGLDESTIAAIADWAYKADDGVLGGTAANCAVCLAEFRDGEVLRLLPKCGHPFHRACIDPWLRSHVNCPLCRAPVLAPSNAASSAAASSSLNGNISPFSDSTSLASSPASVNSYQVNPIASSVALVYRNLRTHRPSASTQLVFREAVEAQSLEIKVQNGILINTTTLNHEEQFNEILPVQRSASTGSLQLSAFISWSAEEERQNKDRIQSSFEEGQLHKVRKKQFNHSTLSLPTEMESSLSIEGRRFSLSRHGRARSSILPL